jgi:hypothetical protein
VAGKDQLPPGRLAQNGQLLSFISAHCAPELGHSRTGTNLLKTILNKRIYRFCDARPITWKPVRWWAFDHYGSVFGRQGHSSLDQCPRNAAAVSHWIDVQAGDRPVASLAYCRLILQVRVTGTDRTPTDSSLSYQSDQARGLPRVEDFLHGRPVGFLIWGVRTA